MYDGVVSFPPVSLGQNIGEGLAMGGDWFFTSHTASDKCKLEVEENKRILNKKTNVAAAFGRPCIDDSSSFDNIYQKHMLLI